MKKTIVNSLPHKSVYSYSPINPIQALYELSDKIIQETKNDKEIIVVETSARCASVSHQLMINSICNIKGVLLFDTTEEVEEYRQCLTDVFAHFEPTQQEKVKKFLGPELGNVKNCFKYLNPAVKTVFVIDPYNLATVKSFFVALKKFKEKNPKFKHLVVVNNAWKRHKNAVPELMINTLENPEIIHFSEYYARSQKQKEKKGYACLTGYPYRNWSIWKENEYTRKDYYLN